LTVMLGWTDLNAEMAACWKGSWNVDPLAFSVPDRLDPELPPDVLLDDEQAAASKAMTARAIPAVNRFLCRRCMSDFPTILWLQ
jgi:hypothetical protein